MTDRKTSSSNTEEGQSTGPVQSKVGVYDRPESADRPKGPNTMMMVIALILLLVLGYLALNAFNII